MNTRGVVVVAMAVMSSGLVWAGPGLHGWGCFANYETIGGLENWPAHVRLMREAGMNTAAVFYRDATSLAQQIDTLIGEGMLETRLPLLVISNAGEDAMADAVGEAEWAAQRAAHGGWPAAEIWGQAQVLRVARARARMGGQWPELVIYGIDEPGHGEGRELNLHYLQDLRAQWNAQGYRIASAVYYPYDWPVARALDVVILGAINGGDARLAREVVRLCGREHWTYAVAMEHYAPAVLRYHVGAWSWASESRITLVWDWARLLGGQADLAAPQMTEHLQAWREGVRDYQWLAATQACLDDLRTNWSGDLLPAGDTTQDAEGQWRVVRDLDALLPGR